MYKISELVRGNYQEDSLVVMSGGMDSTLVLLREVKRIKATGKGSVSAIYHDSDRILESKRKMERLSIGKIISKIKEVYDIEVKLLVHTSSSEVRSPDNTECNLSFRKGYGGGTMLQQSVIWTAIILDIIPDFGSVKLNVLYGFNLADNFHGYSANMMKKTIEDFYQLYIMGDEDSVVNVIFPLIAWDKNRIYKSMLDDYYEFYGDTWTCEYVEKEGEECGHCVPCKTKISTLRGLLTTSNESGHKELLNAQGKIKELYGLKNEEKGIRERINKLEATEVDIPDKDKDELIRCGIV